METTLPAPPINNSSTSGSLLEKANPIVVIKGMLYVALALLIIFVLIKVFHGLNKFSNILGDWAPKTEKEKEQIVNDPAYRENLKWLDDKTGIDAIVKSGKYKKDTAISDYILKKGLTWSEMDNLAEGVWNAKVGPHINSTEVYNAIQTLPSKASVSLMALIFNKRYAQKWNGHPMSAFLSDAMSLEKMQSLMDIIDKKPVL